MRGDRVKVSKILLAVAFFAVSCGVIVEPRVPENLAFAPLLGDVTVALKRDREGKAKKEITLPLKSLNMCYGAEFFHALGQPFYRHGNLVMLEDTAAVPGPEAAGAAQGEEGAEVEPGDGQVVVAVAAATAPTVVHKAQWRHNFYKNMENKEPLPYEECNPLGVLVRVVFWQDPGTSSLTNFHVSNLCKVMIKESVDWHETLNDWAALLAAACASSELNASFKGRVVRSV